MATDVVSELAQALVERGLTVAVAESCTGGLLGHRLTRDGGSSRYFVGGIVAYANAVKTGQLDVSEDSLEQEGAVSDRVAREMARGVRLRLSAGLGLATTGIAGPDGGTAEKPVGMVYIALSHGEGELSQKCYFSGSRDEIKSSASQAALELLHEYLLESGN